MRSKENEPRPSSGTADAGNPENPETENDGAEEIFGALGIVGEDKFDEAAEDIDIPDYVVRDFDSEESFEDEVCFVDAREAAKMLGTSRRDVREMVARGRLYAREGGGEASRLAVSVASVRSLASSS